MSASMFRVAAVQTVSGSDVAANLAAIEPLVSNAAGQGAKLILLPEYFGVFGDSARDKVAVRVVKPLRKPKTTFAMFEMADQSSKRVDAQ